MSQTAGRKHIVVKATWIVYHVVEVPADFDPAKDALHATEWSKIHQPNNITLESWEYENDVW